MPLKKNNPKKIKILWNIFLGLSILFSVYIGTIVIRGHMFYVSISEYGKVPWNNRRLTERIYHFDDLLGYALIPNTHSHETSIYKNNPIDFIIDENGFRVSKNSMSEKKRPLILFIGDSFTFGDFCYAESSFVFLAGKNLNMDVINAGVPGYGLAQMLLLSRKLIEIYTPDYVIVQFSEPIVRRAGCYYAPLGPRFKGFASVPYIADLGETCGIIPPIFKSKVFDLMLNDFIDKNQNESAFIWKICLPLYFYDDINAVLLPKAAFLTKKIPSPCKDNDKIIEYAYSEIDSICRANNSKYYILSINNDASVLRKGHSIYSLKVNTINADSFLWNEFPIKTQTEFYKIYGHLSKNGEVIDKHPNELSHRIIAKSIIDAIKKTYTE
ncbi:TPA: hypothetical protein DCW38_06390 [candidate division WOR-3 bacterium]|uniref:SGNH/GDSL hydrolase family protein n=1 Tax=candidate division WOR-3 bacterium TaxID=2052148 RepID=A0A350HB75_UNCW3|nr:hypothetical protein [candidate division WOR-3 bacterium]